MPDTTNELSRRDFLGSAAAVALVVAAPPALGAAPIATPIKTPMWAVGTPGDFNWQPIAARDRDAAIRIWAKANGYTQGEYECIATVAEQDVSPCPTSGPCARCGCEDVAAAAVDLDAERVQAWDALDGEPEAGDWIDAGLGAICSRCGIECFGDDGAHAINRKAVCEECMTLADWDIADPEHAAELRAEEAEAEND